MKRQLILAISAALIVFGCSKPETELAGKWTSPTVKGFVAEFNADHTGATTVAVPGHAGGITTEMSKMPFKWEVADGKIKITEDKTVYYGKLTGKKLELEVNGAKTVLEKSK
jgi:Flp pilus assembly pilin Flp